MEKIIKYRQLKNNIFTGIIIFLSFAAVLPLLFILSYLFIQGFTAINWDFFVALPKPLGEIGGGIANALFGSLVLVGLATILSVPLGITAGLYLSENQSGKVAYWVRLCVDILQSVPSIVIGVVIYAWLVVTLKSFSGFSGSVALAVMMLPVIVRTTEETLRLIPGTLKEASAALGVPYAATLLKVILPAGISGILTGVLLSIARVAGETAPLLFTAFGNPFFSLNIFKPIESLPHLIFYYATSPYPEWHRLAWGAAFVLVMGVLLLNIMAKIITRKMKVQF